MRRNVLPIVIEHIPRYVSHSDGKLAILAADKRRARIRTVDAAAVNFQGDKILGFVCGEDKLYALLSRVRISGVRGTGIKNWEEFELCAPPEN